MATTKKTPTKSATSVHKNTKRQEPKNKANTMPKPQLYPCRKCVEKYTKSHNQVDTPDQICAMCTRIEERKNLSTITGLDNKERIGYTTTIPEGHNPEGMNSMNTLKTFDELEIADAKIREMLQDFIEHYDFDQPKVYHQGEYTEASEWQIEWKDDIKFDASLNLYMPEYEIKNFKNNSESPNGGNGYNYVPDYTYDTEKSYSESNISYVDIKNWSENN